MAVFIVAGADGSEKPQTRNTNHSCRATRLVGVAVELVKTPAKVVALLFSCQIPIHRIRKVKEILQYEHKYVDNYFKSKTS